MATRNTLEHLKSLLRRARFPVSTLRKALGSESADPALAMHAGDPRIALAILHFALLDMSPLVARTLVDKGHELAGLTDFRFVGAAMRVLREELGMHATGLTGEQFLALGFGERKMLLLCGALEAALQCHDRLAAAERASKVRITPQRTAELSRPRKDLVNVDGTTEAPSHGSDEPGRLATSNSGARMPAAQQQRRSSLARRKSGSSAGRRSSVGAEANDLPVSQPLLAEGAAAAVVYAVPSPHVDESLTGAVAAVPAAAAVAAVASGLAEGVEAPMPPLPPPPPSQRAAAAAAATAEKRDLPMQTSPALRVSFADGVTAQADVFEPTGANGRTRGSIDSSRGENGDRGFCSASSPQPSQTQTVQSSPGRGSTAAAAAEAVRTALAAAAACEQLTRSLARMEERMSARLTLMEGRLLALEHGSSGSNGGAGRWER